MPGHDEGVFGLVSKPSTPRQRELSMLLLAAYLLFIVVGFVVGHTVATSHKVAVAGFAACVGAVVFALCCWAVGIVIWARRRRRARKGRAAGTTQ
jgi:hypothetical protein